VEKTANDRGRYLHPLEHHAPEESRIGYEEHIKILKKLKLEQVRRLQRQSDSNPIYQVEAK
jgi:hypothetical protein